MIIRLQFVSVLVFLTAAIGCGSNNSPDPEKSIKVPSTPLDRLISSAACKVTISTGQLEHVVINKKFGILESSDLQVELLSDFRVRFNEEIKTCFPPYLNPACRTFRIATIELSYSIRPNGILVFSGNGSPSAFITLSDDQKSVDMIGFDGRLQDMFGKEILRLGIERCK